MGEALMPRRGGGVKSGIVTATSLSTLQSDDLIGAKNAILVATLEWQDQSILDFSGNFLCPIISVTIQNGELGECVIGHHGSANVYKSAISHNIRFDPSTGTLSCPGDIVIFGNDNTDCKDYRYVVYD